MFVRKNRGHKGRIYLTIAKNFREHGKTKTKHIKNLGYLDELEKVHADPLTYFKQVAKQMTEEETIANPSIHLSFSPGETITPSSPLRFNLGYSILQKCYYRLAIDSFLRQKQRSLAIDYRLNEVLRLLVFHRILHPSSKASAFASKSQYFESFDFSLHDVYRSLDHFDSLKEALQKHLHEVITQTYHRDPSLAYYDATNYYFEIHYNDEDTLDEQGQVMQPGFRKKGPSKEKRRTPLVQMGLLMDAHGIPMAYDLFPGNESEKLSLLPILKRARRDFGMGRIIAIADRGMHTGDNMFYTMGKKDGYIFSKSIKGASAEFQKYVLQRDEYQEEASGFRYQSRITPIMITYHDANGKKKKQACDQKQVIYYSAKYARRAKRERRQILQKAMALVKNPGAYTKATSYGCTSYIQQVVYDKKTGEIIEEQSQLSLDMEKIIEEAKYDGYYAIVSSELSMDPKEIIRKYRGLWKIEESFKITKSEFQSRPVYVSRKEHIEGHFLTCFVALVIMRLLEIEVKGKYSIHQMITSLKKYECSHLKENYYLFDYRDEVLEELEKIFEVDLSKKILTRAQIKKILKK